MKQKMNRLCAWLLAAALLTGIFNTEIAVSAKADTADIPAAATAEIVASGICGGEGDGTNLTWTLDANGMLTVNGTGAMMEWNSAYGMPWSSYVNSIKTVVIGDSVTTIGKWAFNGCLYLKSVSIGNSVTSIGAVAFSDCSSLKSVTIPDSVMSIGSSAFSNCSGLISVSIGDSVTTIGDTAFYFCSNLKSVTIGASVATIEDMAFRGCSNLELWFNGDAPVFNKEAFYTATATVYYPCDNDTWTADVMQNYGGTLTWVKNHNYESVVTSPTCTEQGYTTYTCSLCGHSFMADYVEVTGHNYENGVCTVCGLSHPNLASFEGKVISIMGDSISTFEGYIPVADGFNLEHKTYYPKHDVTSVDATWWMQTITELDAKLGINESWSGSYVLNTMDGNSGNKGEDAAMASLTRIQNLGSNGIPDVILFFGGTNDIAFSSTLGSFDPITAPTEADLTSTKWTTYADAYTAAVMRMQYHYPNAFILCIFPTENQHYYNAQTRLEYTSVMAAICDHYGISYLDPMTEGFSMDSMLGDVTHPNASGMRFIASCVVDALLREYNSSKCTHAYTSTVTAPTCTEQGYTTYTCDCGDSYVGSYVDAQGHDYENGVCTTCGDSIETMALRYDDHVDMSGKVVEIIDAGTPTSYQVGYGVEENAVPDTAVVTLENDTLVATGIGTAIVEIDGEPHEITVTAAPISLLLLIGQSNMEGNEGDANQSIVCPDGMVYATYGDRYDMDITNATHYAPSALTGQYREINTVGGTDGLSDYPVYMLTDEGDGRKGPDSGFAYEWVRQTGEKVWIVNASHGGTSLNVWQPGTTQYEECQAMFGACAETLRREIAAGHFTLSHMGYFWCQGCNDWDKTAEWYVNNYLTMHESLKTELAFDHDSDETTEDITLEFGGIIPVRAGHDWRTYYREGVYTDTTTASYYESFKDLQMSGPRVAQYWMGNNPELTEIWNVCTIGEDWVWMPDGTNGVAEYFNKHYVGGTVDYETQVQQEESWYTPTTPAAVHDSIHYNQIGYNEVGREAVRNALIYMGINPDYEEKTTVRFVDWTGYREVTEISALTDVGSGTLVVPIVSPITRCKDVTYSVSEGLHYTWYDLTADAYSTVGTLTAVGVEGQVAVHEQEPGMLYAEYLNELPERFCAGTNLWPVLEHNAKYYTVNGWGIHSSNKVFSVTIPVQAGDRIWATSMGANGVNGNTISSGHGIRVTFFSEYGVICSLTSDAVYAEFSANGYLTAPEGTTAVNIPMWNNGDDNELYILNRPHIYGDWYESAGGEERRDCSTCEHYETRKVSVAVVGETEYFSLDAAIEAAAAIKGTVTLLTNLEVPGVFIPKGVTLDLADFTLTTGYLIGLKGSCLTAVPNAGKLIVEKDSLFLSAQGYQNASGQYILPIWDPANECYLFSLFVVNTNNAERGLFIDEENETIRFQFKHQATGDINKGLLSDGSSDNALKVIVRLVWESENGEAYQDFVYNDGFVKKVAVGENGVSYDYSFTLTGYSIMNIDLSTLKVVGMIITDSGAVASGTVWTAEMAK